MENVWLRKFIIILLLATVLFWWMSGSPDLPSVSRPVGPLKGSNAATLAENFNIHRYIGGSPLLDVQIGKIFIARDNIGPFRFRFNNKLFIDKVSIKLWDEGTRVCPHRDSEGHPPINPYARVLDEGLNDFLKPWKKEIFGVVLRDVSITLMRTTGDRVWIHAWQGLLNGKEGSLVLKGDVKINPAPLGLDKIEKIIIPLRSASKLIFVARHRPSLALGAGNSCSDDFFLYHLIPPSERDAHATSFTAANFYPPGPVGLDRPGRSGADSAGLVD